jgi:hypothetical protein
MTMMDEAPTATGSTATGSTATGSTATGSTGWSTDPAGLPMPPVATPSGGVRPPVRLSNSILDRYLRERHDRPEPTVETEFDWFAPVLRVAPDDVR